MSYKGRESFSKDKARHPHLDRLVFQMDTLVIQRKRLIIYMKWFVVRREWFIIQRSVLVYQREKRGSSSNGRGLLSKWRVCHSKGERLEVQWGRLRSQKFNENAPTPFSPSPMPLNLTTKVFRLHCQAVSLVRRRYYPRFLSLSCNRHQSMSEK